MPTHNKESKRNSNVPLSEACPCGSNKTYRQCCEPLHNGAPAHGAEALMRSRYSAFALNLPDYIQRSWHASTRPAENRIANSGAEQTRWLGLQIKRHERIDDNHALVEFAARYKIAGRAFVLHEISRFVCEHGAWFYIDGTIMERS